METIRTREKEEAILEALRLKPTYRYACRRARVSKVALYHWRRDDPDFAARCAEARKDGMGEVEDELIDRALEGDTTALIFLMKSHFRETYGDKVDHTHHALVTFAPDWIALRTALLEALTPYPEALAAVTTRLRALGAGDG